jgi:hypothetical protein
MNRYDRGIFFILQEKILEKLHTIDNNNNILLQKMINVSSDHS